MKNDVLLDIKSISMQFPGVLALKKISFDVRVGEIHALLGENGAGKSTLIKIISGVYAPGEGTLIFNGEPYTEYSVNYSKSRGIETIYQEPTLARDMTVAENLFLDDLPITKLGFIDYEQLFKQSEETVTEMDVALDVKATVKELSLAKIQLITILKCVIKNSKLIIMDEPSSSLSYEELKVLFRIIGYLREKNIAIIYITHNIGDALKIADRATVLRDGEVVGTVNTTSTTENEIVSMMIGRQLVRTNKLRHVSREFLDKDVIFEVKNFTSKKYGLSGISFKLHRGEILGFYGLVGSGRTELLHLIFGVDHADSGELFINGNHVRIDHPSKAVELRMGIVPEDRLEWGIFGSMTVRENISIAFLDRLKRLMLLDQKKEKKIVTEIIDSLKVKTPGTEQQIMYLSGGNKQKCLIGRWLIKDLDILIMDEPTRGIDVGAKSEIYDILQGLAEKEISVIFVSSDIEEIIEMCDRVYVLNKGIISNPFEKDDITKDSIVRQALGVR